jgi:hypothetical protein
MTRPVNQPHRHLRVVPQDEHTLARRIERYAEDPVAAILTVDPSQADRIGGGSVETRVELAADPACPAAVQRALALDKPRVIGSVLGNPGLDPEAGLLAIDSLEAQCEEYIRWMVLFTSARNPGAPEAVLRRMLPDFAAEVAGNRNCSPSLLSQISRDDRWVARSMAAWNRSLPPGDLLRLVRDPHPTVAKDARNAAVRRELTVAREALLLVRSAARRRMVDMVGPADQEAFSRDPDPKIRGAVAGVTREADVLTRLASDPHGMVRRTASARLLHLLDGTA